LACRVWYERNHYGVAPRDGLKNELGESLLYDKVFYVGENDFYIPKDEKGKYKDYSSLMGAFSDSLKTMNGLIPSHVVFNGSVGVLTDSTSVLKHRLLGC